MLPRFRFWFDYFMLPLVPPTALLFLCDIFILLLYFCTGICIHTVLYDDILINPEVVPEGLNPVGSDLLIGRRLLRISGEKRPDMYAWTESWLSAYLFTACGYCKPITQIQMVHPFHGCVWSFQKIDLLKAKALYEHLLSVWASKN